MIMVMRPLPASQNCHSLALGCQCNSRKAQGLRVTSAAAIFLVTGKLRESTIRTSPPGVFRVGAIASILNVYLIGDSTRCPPIDAFLQRTCFRSDHSLTASLMRRGAGT